jgi:hypothetical protein
MLSVHPTGSGSQTVPALHPGIHPVLEVDLAPWLVERVVEEAQAFQMTPVELAGALGVSELGASLLLSGDLALARYACVPNGDWVQDAGSMTRVCLRFLGISRNVSYLLDSHAEAVAWLQAQGHWHLFARANSSFRPLYDVARAEYDRRRAVKGDMGIDMGSDSGEQT